MNDCIEQASNSGFGWVMLLVVVAVVGLVVYKNGWLATEGMLKSLAAKAYSRAEKFAAEARARALAKAKTVSVAAAPVKSKAERIAENNQLVAQGLMTQEKVNEINVAIARE